MIIALSDKQVGKEYDLPYGIVAAKGYDNIVFRKSYKDKEKDQKGEFEPLPYKFRSISCHILIRLLSLN